jgi:hypothetical protein
MMNDAPDALTPAEATGVLAAMPVMLRAEVEALPDALVRWRPGEGEWCSLEVVGHLIETEERGFAGRIRTILAEERPRFAGWDPSAVALARNDDAGDAATLLAEFTRRRTESVALVEGLVAADLDRGGDHPEVGFLTVRDLLYEWIHHDRNHFKQLLDITQSYAWPLMGNARRFSAPEIGPIIVGG